MKKGIPQFSYRTASAETGLAPMLGGKGGENTWNCEEPMSTQENTEKASPKMDMQPTLKERTEGKVLQAHECWGRAV